VEWNERREIVWTEELFTAFGNPTRARRSNPNPCPEPAEPAKDLDGLAKTTIGRVEPERGPVKTAEICDDTGKSKTS